MSEQQISINTLKSYLHKIRVDENTILAVMKNSPLAEEQNLTNLMTAARHLNFKGSLLVVIIDSMDDIKSLNKTEMQKHGWYRMEDVARLLSKK